MRFSVGQPVRRKEDVRFLTGVWLAIRAAGAGNAD